MNNTLRDAIKFGFKPVVNPNFSSEDQNVAAINAIREQLGIPTECSYRDLRPYATAAFALMEEVLDELIPAELTNILGSFAEIKSFGRGDEVIFEIRNKGMRRARLSITKGARGGIYKAAQLDNDYFQMPTYTQTVSVYVSLEDILLGRYTLEELFNNILQGFVEIVYKETVEALRTAKTLAPSANIKSASTLSLTDVDSCVRIANAYGRAVIIGFKSALDDLSNKSGVSGIYPNVSAQDLDDIRNMGRVGIYKGTQVIELPNYLVDNTNANWMFDEKDIFILPADAKPVKVAYRGDLTMIDNTQPTGSRKIEAHKMLGVGLALANNVCVVTIAG